jgi:hypothetical protein
MKKEIKDEKIRRSFSKELKDLCIKYNAFPLMEIDIKSKTARYVLYELDKMTTTERMGTI